MMMKRLVLALFLLAAPLLVKAADEAAKAAATDAASDSKPAEPVVAEAPKGEKFEFQAETSRLMDILINSLYSQKEVFLRELISNSADALDKLRFLSISDPKIMEQGGEALEIRIKFDKEAKTLTLTDSGIGMTKDDLIQNLGTVAKSGTTQFVESLSSGQGDLSLIGQFGVGFYSAFLVSDKVVVISKNNDDPVQHVWESTADSSFVVYPDPEGNTLKRGTKIILHLKEDATAYTEQSEIEKLVQRYSEFITFPIYLYKSSSEIVEDEDAAKAAEEETKDGEEKKPDEPPKPKTKSITVWNWERVNKNTAIWTRSPSDVKVEEYKEFYKAVSKDTNEPLEWSHFKAEGEIEFKSILYIPQEAPSGLYENYYGASSSIRLYVRKVLIADKFEDLMPRYLNFVKGVLDSEDLPLSVSREQLQQSKILHVIRKKLVRKVLDVLREMQSDNEKYNKFFKGFGKNIKLGVIEDSMNRNKLMKLLRFHTTKTVKEGAGNQISLDDYLKAMPDWQKAIYYIAGPDLDTIQQSPFLDRATQKGVDVILLVDPTDEYVVQNIPDYEGKKMQSLTKEGLKFGDETETDRKREKYYKDNYKSLTEWMEKVLTGKVEKVVVSTARVAENPALLVTSQFGYTANQERLAKSQAFGDHSKMGYMKAKRTLEINPRHPIIAKLNDKVKAGDEKSATDICVALYDAAAVSSGFDIEDIKQFSSRMTRLLNAGLGVVDEALLPEAAISDDDLDAAGGGSAQEVDLGSGSDEL